MRHGARGCVSDMRVWKSRAAFGPRFSFTLAQLHHRFDKYLGVLRVHFRRDAVPQIEDVPRVIAEVIEDARHPLKYRMLMGMVDVIFADVAQPDQARIVGLNASYFLKNEGNFVISIKASCIDSTAAPEAVFSREVKKMQEEQLKPQEQITLEPYERDHAVVVGIYRKAKKA